MERGRRSKRVGALIQREIGGLILREIKDPRLEGVTITNVIVTDDLTGAKIYFFKPQGKDIKEVMRGLESAKGFFKGELSDHMKARRVPDLFFIYDDSLEFFDKLKK